MITQAKGTLLQRTRRMLGRGYQLLTIQEIKLANALQRKFSFGYPLVRILGFIVKLALVAVLLFLFAWLLVIVLAIVAFFVADFSKERQEKERKAREETYGTIEHMTKYPTMYDN
ncbi:DUF3742 family protein [Entomomonas sp. E2T0]|uniref:DUF3742 family protein n=1 Tax=Entomomonas sp. E2T0 TaxID=2930213 RepID=UPI002228299D|nr:DUF3742 family protein [Entomomonas sp. E2T0]UYZ83049.1 DUF3742 family protein [Entomomonas sp. E2T0]